MKLVTFRKFEAINKLVENHSINDLENDPKLLEGTDLTIEEINEGLLRDIFGGWWKKIHQNLLRAIPGAVLKKADALLDQYEKEKINLSKDTLKEKDKKYKAEISKDDDPENAKKYDKIMAGADDAINSIEDAKAAKFNFINKQLKDLAKDKSDVVRDYINLKLAEVIEKIAVKELDDLKKNSSEDEIDKLTNEVKKKKEEREKAQKVFQLEIEKKKNDPKNAVAGERWERTKNDGKKAIVELVGDVDKKGEVKVKGDKGTFLVNISSFIRKIEDKEELKKAA